MDGLVQLLHRRARADQRTECRAALRLLHHAAAFEFVRALVDCAGQHGLEFLVVHRRKDEFVGSGLAGVQRQVALTRFREGNDYDVLADGANFLQDFDAVGGRVADAVQIEQHGAKSGILDGIFDARIGVRQGHAKIG